MPKLDRQLDRLLRAELKRQQETLSLIPSENIASDAVLDVGASVLTNKYSEGYPGHRYYAGNEHVDAIERLAISRIKKLFGAQHANVQPHAGAIANLAVYAALLKPGDRVLAMDLRAGGHLTHGFKRNLSGQVYRFAHYGLDRHGLLDYRELARLAKSFRPKLIVSGASAYPRQIDFARIGRIAKRVGAYHLADVAHLAGLIIAKQHPNPFPHADVVTFTTHKTLRGPRGAIILSRRELASDIDRAVMPGLQGGPLDQQIAAKAQAFAESATPAFRSYQRRVRQNADAMAKTFTTAGLTLSSGGTDTHLLVIDVRSLGLTGAIAERALEKVGIITNKNLIANDPRPASDPSGLRLGTPSITSRGFSSTATRELGQAIVARLKAPRSARSEHEVSRTVRRLTKRYPIYRSRVR